MKESKEYIILKTIEELAELQEVLIKVVTKPIGALEDKRLEHLIEELGDVELRVTQIQKELGVTDKVEKRILKKMRTLGLLTEEIVTLAQ